MSTYRIEFDIERRYRCAIVADGPEEAIEQFWAAWHEDGVDALDAACIDGDSPTGLSMTDTAGNPVAWGSRTDLS